MGTPVALQIFVAAAKAVVRVFIIAAVGCGARRKERRGLRGEVSR